MRFLGIAFTFCLGLVATAPGAGAAPQAMLLVAKGDTIQFLCDEGQCLAEASAICLQEERATPHAGTPYEPVDERRYGTGRPNGLHLVGISISGEEKPLPLETMQIISEREHMAVRFAVTKSVLAEHALDRLELRITQNVVIAPVWGPGDAHPHLDDELELVLGPLRATAENALQQRQDAVVSTRLLGDFLNNLPRDRVASVEERQKLYRNVVAARAGRAVGAPTPKSLADAQEALDACAFIRDTEMWYRTLQTQISRYRSCIGYRHDRLIKDVNKTYWNARKGIGS